MSAVTDALKDLGDAGKNILGGGGEVKTADAPDYEAEKKRAEEEAQKRRSQLAALGMSGTILGGSVGDDSKLAKKRLLGE